MIWRNLKAYHHQQGQPIQIKKKQNKSVKSPKSRQKSLTLASDIDGLWRLLFTLFRLRNSSRIQNLLDLNMIEVGKLLFHLTNTGYLISAGRGRGTTYSVSHSSAISVNPHHQININGA